jgi:hypothetical protein
LREQVFVVFAGTGQGQMFEQVAKIEIRFMAVGFCRFDQTEEDAACFGSFGAACEQPVLSSKGKGTDGIFNRVSGTTSIN